MATITIAVTVSNPGSGNKYYLDGVLGAYAATPGNTYKFDQSAGSNSGHPLRFATQADGANSSSYTTGVTTSGTPGSSGAYTQIVVTATTPQALFYYCTSHNGMGSSFNTGGTGTVQLQDRDGFRVQNFSSDQTSVGQIYYNSTSGQFKGILDGGAPIGTWAAGANINAARSGLSGFGTTEASFVTGGSAQPGDGGAYTTLVENYNGSSWSETTEFTTARNQHGSFGTTTAAVICGGTVGLNTVTNSTQTWNGNSWTEVAELNTARSYMINASNGTSTAGITSTGYTTTAVYNVESWNGVGWTEKTEPNTNIYIRATGGAAPNTDTILFGGGYLPARSANSETWNGSAWTEVADLNTARADMGGSGTSSTNALGFGGRDGTSPPGTVLTEFYNGSTWTEVANQGVATIFYFGSTGGGSTSALKVGGSTVNPPTSDYANNTEEWNAAEIQVKTLTTS